METNMRFNASGSTWFSFSQRTVLAAAIALAAAGVQAQAPAPAQPLASPVGLWKTIDDETGKAKSLVRIVEVNGVLSGRIEKLLTPGKENQVCDKCEGALKDQPVLGMEILKGLRKGDDVWEGGTILDPNNGKT